MSPRDLAVLRTVAQDAIERSPREATLGALLLLGLALGAAVGLNIGRRRIAHAIGNGNGADKSGPWRRSA